MSRRSRIRVDSKTRAMSIRARVLAQPTPIATDLHSAAEVAEVKQDLSRLDALAFEVRDEAHLDEILAEYVDLGPEMKAGIKTLVLSLKARHEQI